MGRTRGEILRAERRVAGEGMVPVEEVAALLGEPPPKVVRWAVKGTRGLFLDAAHRSGVWYSSYPAALRILRGLYELDDAHPVGGAIPDGHTSATGPLPVRPAANESS